MKCTIAFICSVLFAGSALGAEPSPELLKKIADTQAAVSEVFKQGALTMTTKAEELDGGGKPVSEHEFVMRLSHPNGQRREELLRATEDGKDVLEQAKKKRAAANHEERRGMRAEDSPFSAESQPKYRFSLVGTDPSGLNRLRIGFEPRPPKAENTLIGEAVVDATSGEIVSVHARPASLPTFVDRLEVTLDYSAQTAQGRTLSRMTIEGQGGLLFIKRRFRALMLFSDFEAPKGSATR